MNALESRQSSNRSAVDAGMREIELDDFVSRDGTGVGNANGDGKWAACGDV